MDKYIDKIPQIIKQNKTNKVDSKITPRILILIKSLKFNHNKKF